MNGNQGVSVRAVALAALMFAWIAIHAEKSFSASCSCTFTGKKDYLAFDERKNRFGKRKVYRKWTCEYSCDAGQGPEKQLGTYEIANTGEDNGLEGICEGTVYKSEFNAFVMREVYVYKSTESFSPHRSKAAEVKSWADQRCQAR